MGDVLVIENIKPIGKPRMTQRDKWAKRDCVNNYYQYKDILTSEALKQKYTLGNNVEILFQLPFPNYWSKKKKKEMVNKPHQIKPDIDNLIKSVLDSLSNNDQTVFKVFAVKSWAEKGKIIIKNV